MSLAQNTAERTLWDFAMAGNNGRIDNTVSNTDKFDVAALLTCFHETRGLKAALDDAEG